MDWAKGEFAGRHCLFFPSNLGFCALLTGNCPLQRILGHSGTRFPMSDGLTNGKTKKGDPD